MTIIDRLRYLLRPPRKMTMAEFVAVQERIKAPRRHKLFARRSAASKKGWETRRAGF